MRAHALHLSVFLVARPAWARHVLAAVCAGLAWGLSWLLSPLPGALPILLSLAAVLVAALTGGPGPAWLATFMGALSIASRTASQSAATTILELSLFLAVGGLVAVLAGRRGAVGVPSAPPSSRPTSPHEGLEAHLLRSLGDAVLATDAHGVVRYLNPAAATLLQCPEQEVMGAPLAQVLRSRPESGSFPLRQTAKPSAWSPWPRALRRRDGGELPIEECTTPLRGLGGEELGAVWMFRDATSRRQFELERSQLLARERAALAEAQAQRELMESLFFQAPVAIAVFRGPEHVCELLNPQARVLLEVDGAALGKPLRDVQPDMDPGLLRLLDEVYREGVPFSAREVPLPTLPLSGTSMHSKPQRYHDVSWQPWRDARGVIQGVMAVAVDVTGLVVSRRAAEDLAGELREVVQARDEFLSIASHELRTPITSVQLQLQFLLRMAPAAGTEGTTSLVHRRVEATLRSVAQLHQLVATLLDVSRIRAGRLDLHRERMDLSSLTQELVSRAQEDAAGARCPVRLVVAEPLYGNWDRVRLEQVVTNLLSNAFKYGAQRPVEIHVTREGDFACLSVKDQGIGIAPEDQARIFHRFERAVSQRHYSGFGLGLWIVRQIVEALDGDIRVESQPNAGSTFIVRLPLESASTIDATA
ncbi:sensor histidine kinase [Myxococcus landrumensis]|uniref:histidine kinase n=1 Tax=Myxococcus landrumensis TaxID=2813577 RepID=A0ABX7N6X3_9BACT|nr:ATP-binding protein [Myxococcus landrumus]QSQ12098.1 PAS domain-containing protein [Myxococcus landrumus]